MLLEIRLLGDFSFFREEARVSSPKPKKARLLVAHLALHRGKVFLREDLAAHLWPDQEPVAARFNLRQLLASIRREAPDLAPYLVGTDHQTLSLAGAEVSTDVERFIWLSESQPEHATALYAGQLLPGVDDDWVNGLRADLEQRRLQALETLADRSSPGEAARWLKRAIECDVFNERLQQKLLAALAEVGDLAGVRTSYRRFQEVLHRELNASPSAGTAALYRQLVDGPTWATAPDAQKPSKHGIPMPTTPILGREAELCELENLLQKSRLVTLLGPGGSGKTRLAIELGRQQVERRSGGVWFVDLSSLAKDGRVDQAAGQVLGLAQPKEMDWIHAIIAHLGEANCLLILDNCEHVVAGCAEFAHRLITTCPNLNIIATSRTPLGVPGEQRYPLASLALPDPGLSVESPLSFSAVRLFQERARLAEPGFALSAQNAASVVGICRAVDAMPLAIEMAAARLASISLTELASRLLRSAGLLSNSSRVAAPRHQTLESLTAWSFELLSEPARTLLVRLAVFAGGSTLEGAEAACCFGLLETGCSGGMSELVDASLLQFRDGRYTLLMTIQDFARQRPQWASEEGLLGERHLDYFRCRCAEISRLLSELGPDRTAALFRPELNNIRAALRLSLNDHATDESLAFAADASAVLSVLQLDGEAVKILQEFLARPIEEPGLKGHTAALKAACKLFQSQYADFDRATARENTILVCCELAGLARANDDRASLVTALTCLGAVRLWWHRALAKEALDEAIEVARSLPAEPGVFIPLRLLGQWHYDEGSLDLSMRLFQEASEKSERSGDVAEQIYALQAQSHLHREQGRYPEALEGLLEIQAILARRPDARASAFNDLRLAELHLDLWEFGSMREPLGRADAFFRATGSRLHALLADGLCRYLAAYEGRVEDCLNGVALVLEKLLTDAKVNPSACWHGACIDMEALSLCLSKLGRSAEAEWGIQAAKFLRSKDWARVSPSVEARWSRLEQACGLDHTTVEPPLCADEVVTFARRVEGTAGS